MNKKALYIVVLFSLFALLVGGCRRDKAVDGVSVDRNSQTDNAEVLQVRDNRVPAASVKEGVIDFSSGDVEWSSEGDQAWYPAEIGQIVRTGDSVRTFEDSWCELKFSDMSVIRLHGDTQFTVESIYSEETSSMRLSGRVLQGTVAAKARKLAGKETLQISTQTVVCAVRGTVFLVSADDTHTNVAVSEGSVALVPSGLEIDARRSAGTEDQQVLLDRVEEAMPVLNAGEELSLGAREQDDLLRTVEDLSVLLDTGTVDTVDAAAAGSAVAAALGAAVELTDDSAEILDELDRVEISAESDADRPVRVAMSWVASPADASITVDGDIEGSGSVSGNWIAGETVEVVANRPGYREFRGTYTAAEREEYRPENIALEKLPTRYFDVVLAQSEGSVIVNGVDRGAAYEGAVSWGEDVHIRMTAEGRNERRLDATYEDAPSGRIDVDLEPVIQTSLPVVTSTVVGLEGVGDSIVLADQEGTLVAVDGEGRRLWREVTTNAPNENARPQLIGKSLFFSGINEFLVLDAASGADISRVDQTPDTMHLFGRRSVAYGDMAAYPAKNEIILLNPSTGKELRRLPVPGGSQMTPVVRDREIWTVAEDGTVLGFDESGARIGRIPTNADRPIGHAPALSGNIIYYGDRSGVVWAVDLARGRVLWERSVGSAIQHEIAVSGSDLVVYANHDVFILDRTTGQIRFPAIRGFSAPPVTSGGFLYGGTEAGEVIAVNAHTGEVVAQEAINGQVSSAGIAMGDQVYLGTDQGEILVMNSQDPSLLEIGPEPKAVQ